MTQVKIDKPIKNYLMDFGLTEKEVKLYLALLKTGPNTIMNLARETGIKRSTTHNNVEELIKKGLVSQTNYGERRMVVAEDPGKLSFLLEQKKWDMKKLEDNMTEIVGMIKQSVPESEKSTSVEVKYYQGEKGFKEVCQRSIEHSDNEVLFITNIDEWRKVYTEQYGKEYYIPARIKKNLFLKALAVRGGVETEKFKKEDTELLRETRYLPNNINFKSTLIICDDEVSIMTSGEPYTAIVLEGKDIAETFKQLFSTLWANSSLS